jgi:hypothetical protein
MAFSQDAKIIAIAYHDRPGFIWRINRQRGQKSMRCIRKDDILKKPGEVLNAPEVVLWQPDLPNVLILYQDTMLVEWNLHDNLQKSTPT